MPWEDGWFVNLIEGKDMITVDILVMNYVTCHVIQIHNHPKLYCWNLLNFFKFLNLSESKSVTPGSKIKTSGFSPLKTSFWGTAIVVNICKCTCTLYIYILNISNSLTSVFVFNVFPPKLVPSKKFLGLFPLVLQQPCQCLELLPSRKAMWMSGRWPRNLCISHKNCTFCRSLVTHVSHQNKKKNDKLDLLEKHLVNCNLAQELKVHSTVPMVFDSMDPERTDPFQGKHNHVFWPHDIHSGGRCFDPHLALRLARSLENPYVVQNYLTFVRIL